MTAPGPGNNNSRTYGRNSIATNHVDTINMYPGGRRRLPLLLVLAVLAFLLALGDFVWCLWRRPGGDWGPYAWFLALAVLALLTAIGAIAGSVPAEGSAGRPGAKLAAWLTIGSVVLTGGTAFTFRYTVDHRDIPVGVVIEGQQPLGGGGNMVLLLVVPQQPPGDRREGLRLSFDLGEDDAGGPACAHKSRVVVTALTSGVEPHEAAGLPAKARADFHVGKGWDSGLRFHYELRDVEAGCLVRLQKVSGTLHD
ncbi:hypothetical protein [Streptomyces luteireticuli]|uniref:DUF4131 domain-containing protein n=1 Tax=Streptomyces luteireticuli TaxID=173858 RepID=A0ABN0Z506_9ACTN